MDEATAALATAGAGGAALVAFRNLEATAKRWHPEEVQGRVNEALESINFNRAVLDSPRFGSGHALGAGGSIEVYRDWIIFGQESHDVDVTTRGQAFLDGSVQVTSSVVAKGGRNKSSIVNEKHDLRTAQLQIVSSTWSVGAPIHPDQANEARRLVEQLSAHIETLKEKTVTAADIRAMVDAILNSIGQPPAEKAQAAVQPPL